MNDALSRRDLLGSLAVAAAPRVTRRGGRTDAASAEVKMHQARPALFVNGRAVYPIFYHLTDSPGGRWSWEELPRQSLENFARAGFDLFYVDLWLAQMWRAEGPLDISLARRQIRGVLDVRSSATVFLRVHVNAPDWWNKKHRDELTRYANGPLVENQFVGLHRLLAGDLEREPRASLASARWLSDASARLAEFCEKLSRTPEGNAVAGMHLACGVFHEWHYWGFIDNDPDTGPAMTRHFRSWLGAHYDDDEDLRDGWKDALVTIPTAEVPGVERNETHDGIFRDPARGARVRDYFECQHEAVADAILQFCAVAKKNWPRPLVTGAFYGYFFNLFGRAATGGHLKPQRVLGSGAIDYLSAPQAYGSYSRDMGGSGQSRGLLESVRLAGKLWLDEMDQKPSLLYPLSDGVRAQDEKPEALADSIAILRRNLAQSYTRGMGLWFYDFGEHFSTGWWNHPALLEEIRKLKGVFEEFSKREFARPADVLMVSDTDVFYHLALNDTLDPLTDPVAVNQFSAALFRSGAVADQVYLADLDKLDLSRYRAVIFANTWLLTEAQRAFIREKVARAHRHLIWCYAPGYTDGDRLETGLIQEATGIRMKKLDGAAAHELVVTAGGWPDARIRVREPFGPVFVPDDAAAEVLGTLDGRPGFVRKRERESTGWFSSLPLANEKLLTRLLGECGAHVWDDAGDTVLCGGGILAVHTLPGGRRRLALRNGRNLTLTLAPRSTTLLDSESGRVLL